MAMFNSKLFVYQRVRTVMESLEDPQMSWTQCLNGVVIDGICLGLHRIWKKHRNGKNRWEHTRKTVIQHKFNQVVSPINGSSNLFVLQRPLPAWNLVETRNLFEACSKFVCNLIEISLKQPVTWLKPFGNMFETWLNRATKISSNRQKEAWTQGSAEQPLGYYTCY